MKSMTLGSLLSQVDSLNWTAELYLPANANEWTANTACAVLEEDEEETDSAIASYLSQASLRYALGIQAVQDVVANAKLQNSAVSASDLLRAFVYYFKNDAFLTLTAG